MILLQRDGVNIWDSDGDDHWNCIDGGLESDDEVSKQQTYC